MSKHRLLVAVFAAGTLAACQRHITGPGTAAPSSQPAEVRSFVRLVNEHRVDEGCPALIWNERVAAVAAAHSADMATTGYFSHTNPAGQSPFDRLRAAGITFTAAAENIAYGQPTGQAVLTSWLGSSGHRTNIENCNYTEHGVGLVDTRWTHVFIRPG